MLPVSWFNLSPSSSQKIAKLSCAFSFLLFSYSIMYIVPCDAVSFLYDVLCYHGFQRPFFLVGHFHFLLLLSLAYRNESFRLSYIALDCLNLLLSWCIILDGTMPMFNLFIILLNLDEAVDCVLLFLSKLLARSVSVRISCIFAFSS